MPTDSQEIEKVRPGQYFLIAAGMIAALWAWWAIEHFTGWRVVRRRSSLDPEPIAVWYMVIATPLILIGATIFWRRAAGIAENGVIIEAHIKSFGLVAGGMRNFTLAYNYNGVEYKVKTSVSEPDVADKNPGDSIQLIVDKRNPKRFNVKF